MPTGPRRARAKGLTPGQQTLKFGASSGQRSTASEASEEPARRIEEAGSESRSSVNHENLFACKRKAEAMTASGVHDVTTGADADALSSSAKRPARSKAAGKELDKASSSEDLQASTRVLSLRERLAAKQGTPLAATLGPPPKATAAANAPAPDTSGAGNAGEVEHKLLGGLNLQWRLLMTEGIRPRKKPSRDLAERERSPPSLPPTLPTVATPCRSEQAPSEASKQAEEQSPEPQTPTPSERAAARETPTPPQSQSGGSSQRDELDADEIGVGNFRRRSSGSTSDSPTLDADGAGANHSVKELKTHLNKHRIDFANCVEKHDLQVLWDTFQKLRQEPLDELRSLCTLKGCSPSRSADAEECARLLLEVEQKRKSSAEGARSTPLASARSDTQTVKSNSDARAEEAALRGRAATTEADRILALQQGKFRSRAAWGFAVLDTNCKTVQGVSRAFRALMLKLHPDRAGGYARLGEALETVREAKECCERAVSMRDPPSQPRKPSARVTCTTPGCRQIKMEWSAPEVREEAPVRRYIVAAFDPSYGRAITVAVLEPDYSEELGRFVPVEELLSYTLQERSLQKVPVFRQAQVRLQVAAANEAGQSPWATVTVPLRAA